MVSILPYGGRCPSLDTTEEGFTTTNEWDEFKSELMLWFGTTPYEDGFGKLCKLKQTSTMREYRSRFERLLGKSGVLTNKQETTCFISRLRESLRADFRA